MPMNLLKALIFDLDGTLLDSMPDIMRVGNSLLSRRGLPARNREEFTAAVGMGLEQLYTKLLGGDAVNGLAQTMAEEARLVHERVRESTAAPYPGIVEMLEALSGQGLRLGVLSNKPHAAVTGSVERFFPGIAFTDVRGAFPERPVKPGSETALSMLRGMGVEPCETAMIGDGEPDMMVALAAGMVPVACAWGFTSRERLAGAGARFIADDPPELRRLISSLALSP